MKIVDVGRVRFVLPENIAFKCAKCGQCCREVPGDLNEREIKRLEQMGYRNFYEGQIFRSFRRDPHTGACIFLSAENLCKIHDIKPASCRGLPFTVFAVRPGKILAGIDKHVYSSCKGFYTGDMDLEELRRVAPHLEVVIRDVVEYRARQLSKRVTDPMVLRDVNLFLFLNIEIVHETGEEGKVED